VDAVVAVVRVLAVVGAWSAVWVALLLLELLVK
jgi:hypothetical protein